MAKNHGSPDPHKDSKDTYKRHVEGSITVRGQVETHTPPELTEQRHTERQEDKADEKKHFIVGVLTVIGVIAYTGLTFWQDSMTRTQFRTDERPWIKVQQKLGPANIMAADQPLQTGLELISVGKTPARRPVAYGFLELVDSNRAPNLPDPEHENSEKRFSSILSTGVLFPGQSVDGIVTRRGLKPGTSELMDVPLSSGEYQSVQEGKSYLSFYVVVYYWDIYGAGALDHLLCMDRPCTA